jgi:glucosamine-6-phosphate deaminase
MRVLITPDYTTLSEEAAAFLAKSIQARRDITLGLPTGHTPLGMYAELIRRHQSEGLDFADVRTFNLDEFVGLTRDDPQSYHAYMRTRFFDHVNVTARNAHIPDASPDVDPGVECERYEDLIRQSGGIDLLTVGIGINGHIAFNEPGSPFASRTRVVTLAPETIQNAGKGVPHTAVTMGIGTILDARKILLLASGARKAAIVSRSLGGPISETVPASALQLHPDVVVIMDEAAAGV